MELVQGGAHTGHHGAGSATLNLLGAERRRLWAVGVTGSAVILAMRDTGRRLAGNAVLELDLEITLEHGPAYRTTFVTPIGGTDTAPYAAGARYTVKVDPAAPDKVAFSA